MGEISLINGRYKRIQEEVGEGGTATVLICKDIKRDDKIVALKFYDPNKKSSNVETADAIYKREIMALADSLPLFLLKTVRAKACFLLRQVMIPLPIGLL